MTQTHILLLTVQYIPFGYNVNAKTLFDYYYYSSTI